MQVLQAQYPTMYTRKFRVFYSDFTGSGNDWASLLLFTMPKANEILHTKIRVTVPFSGSGLTFSQLYLVTAPQSASRVSTLGVFGTQRANQSYIDGKGLAECSKDVLCQASPTDIHQKCNDESDTSVYLSCSVNGGSNINNLTAGEAEVWVTTFRLP